MGSFDVFPAEGLLRVLRHGQLAALPTAVSCCVASFVRAQVRRGDRLLV